jgi:hypothetical protein
MPLSKPAPRQHIHTRKITCQGFQREDGLWDIEGEITDTKTYSFDNEYRGGVNAGEPIHHMIVRITVDDDMNVLAAEAETLGSPFAICTNGAPPVEGLKGLKIGPGWRNAVAEVLGRIKGCTHIRDLVMGPLAQCAYQTIIPVRMRKNAGKPVTKKPAVLGTCVAYDPTGPIVQKRWPQFYTGTDGA